MFNMSFESLKYIISQKSYVAGLFLYLLLLFNFFLEQFAFVVNSPKIQILIYSNLHKIDCTLFLFIFFLNSTNIVEVFRTISRPPQIFLAEIWTIYDKIYNQIIDLFHQNCDFVENFFQNSCEKS